MNASVGPIGARQARPARDDIQALRAIAVALVVLFHLWPARLPGGYVGVDVFFVISGFLITSHLASEAERTGRISLGRFWARRVRRLLPASLLVLACVTIATFVLVPDSFWPQYTQEISGAAFYGLNWVLASNAVDYLAADNAASPVQHFWSLGVEEQFYVVWPLLLLLAMIILRESTPRSRRRAMLAATCAVTAVSLATSVIWTATATASAYFVTPTRMWEFGIGALVALVAPRLAIRGRLAAVAGVAGAVLLLTAALSFDASLPFPGAIALIPVLGTAAIIAAGTHSHVNWRLPAPVIAPIRFVGDASYSIYLWHWPLIVIVPIVTGSVLVWQAKVGVLVVTLVLAGFTKRFVEDRFRRSGTTSPASGGQRRRLALTFAAAAVASALLIAGNGTLGAVFDARVAAAEQAVRQVSEQPCFGAAALAPGNECSDPFGDTGVMTPALAKADTNYVADPEGGWQCETPPESETPRVCVRGVTDAAQGIALLGDSHAMHYLPAVAAIADAQGWSVRTYIKSACAGTGADDVVLPSRADDQQRCASWGRQAVDDIIDDPSIRVVVYSSFRSAYYEDDGSERIDDRPYDDLWDRLIAAGKRVLVIGDVPWTTGEDVPDCIARNPADASPCEAQRSAALQPDAMMAAASRYADSGLTSVDLTDYFCSAETCRVRVGGVIVYSDSGHITKTWARTLAPYISPALTELFRAG